MNFNLINFEWSCSHWRKNFLIVNYGFIGRVPNGFSKILTIRHGEICFYRQITRTLSVQRIALFSYNILNFWTIIWRFDYIACCYVKNKNWFAKVILLIHSIFSLLMIRNKNHIYMLLTLHEATRLYWVMLTENVNVFIHLRRLKW